ncbi:MAG TPA: YfhO family protein, partial [Chloroflexota bacterium]|nr:YfhO family protein [Chloroflexota bacterium]
VMGLAAFAILRLGMGARGQEFALPHGRLVVTWALLLGAGIALSLASLGRHTSRPALVLIVAVLIADLFMAREPMEYNRPQDSSVYTAQRALPDYLTGLPTARVLSMVGERYQLADEAELKAKLAGQLTSDGITGYLTAMRLREIVAPNTGMVAGLATVDGYDGGLLPTLRYARLKQALMSGGEYKADQPMRETAGPIPSSRLLGAFGVGYVLAGAERSAQDDGWEDAGTVGASVRLLRNRNLLPRAFVVHRAEVHTDDGDLLAALGHSDLAQVVLLSEDVQFEGVPPDGGERVKVTADRTSSVDITVDMNQPGFLVLSDSYYPGWKVYVDGTESQILRANYTVRAVPLGTGSHQVRFVYDPVSLKLGVGLSLVGTLLVVAAPALVLRRRLSLGRRSI